MTVLSLPRDREVGFLRECFNGVLWRAAGEAAADHPVQVGHGVQHGGARGSGRSTEEHPSVPRHRVGPGR